MDISVPEFPESISEGEVVRWYKEPGEYVERDELVVDVETEKTTIEIAAPVSGRLTEIFKPEGELVGSKELLATLDESAEPDEEESAQEEDESERVEGRNVAPAARKLAAEAGIDIRDISGTGRRGMITKMDVREAIEARDVAKTKPQVEPVQIDGDVGKQVIDIEREERRVPMSRLRSTIARRLVEVQQTSAMLTTFNEADMGPIRRMRAMYQDEFTQRHNGTRLGFMSFFVRACVESLKRFPAVNASIDGSDIIYHGYYDIGVAVSTDRGLVVPVIRDADALGLHQIEDQITDYGTRARDNKLKIDELQGGTFTISNGGVFGSLLSTPILNPPQTAILGMHAIQDRPVAEDGEIVIKPMMYLALSYDHRLIDGQEAVRFLVAIKGMLEDPARILLEL